MHQKVAGFLKAKFHVIPLWAAVQVTPEETFKLTRGHPDPCCQQRGADGLFDIGFHDLDDHCTAMVVDDCTEVDDRNKIWASRDTEDGHYPKPLANSVRSVSEQAPANEAKVDSGDSPIGSLVPVFLVPLGLCNVCSACFYLLLRTKQQGFDALFSPGHFLPFEQENESGSNRKIRFKSLILQ